MIVGVNAEAEHGLDTGFGDRNHPCVAEPSVGQIRGDGPNIRVGDAAQDLLAVTAPPRQSVDVVLAQPFLVSPTTSAIGTDELRQARNMVAVEAGGDSRQGVEDGPQFSLLCPAETDLRGERLSMAAVGDDHLVFADRVQIPTRDDTEVQQHLLDVFRQLLTTGGIRDLHGVLGQRRTRPVAFEEGLQECTLDRCRRVPQPFRNPLVSRSQTDQFSQPTPAQRLHVLNVQLEQIRPRGDLTLVDITRTPTTAS